MKIFYNPEDEGFYHDGIQSSIPDSAIQISEKQYKDFRYEQSKGKVVKLVDNNFIYSPREITKQEVESLEDIWVSSELVVAGEELDKVQDSDPKAFGTVSQWREYRKALRAWPDHKDFPNKESRPVSPLIKE